MHALHPKVANIWLAWNFDPSIIVIAIIVYFYARGLKKYRKNYSAFNVVVFFLGVAFLVLALCSPINYLADDYFLFHMIQHLLIVMLAAPTILLGAPSTPLISGLNKQLPKIAKKLLTWRIYRGVLRFFAQPPVAILVYLTIFWGWHLPVFYNFALNSELVHYAQHFTFFASAIFLWWSIIDPRPHRSKFFYLLRILWVFLLTIANSGLSALIVFTPREYYQYGKTNKDLILTALSDQKIGGLIMWLAGNMMLLVIAICVFLVYYNKKIKDYP